MLSLPILSRALLSFCIQTLYDHPLSLPWIKRCHRNERSIIGQNLGVIDGFLNHWECHLCSVDSRARAGYIPRASEQTGLPVAMHENKMWKKRPCMKSKMLKKIQRYYLYFFHLPTRNVTFSHCYSHSASLMYYPLNVLNLIVDWING